MNYYCFHLTPSPFIFHMHTCINGFSDFRVGGLIDQDVGIRNGKNQNLQQALDHWKGPYNYLP